MSVGKKGYIVSACLAVYLAGLGWILVERSFPGDPWLETVSNQPLP